MNINKIRDNNYLNNIVRLKIINEFHLLTKNEVEELIEYEQIIDYLKQYTNKSLDNKDLYNRTNIIDKEIITAKKRNKIYDIKDRIKKKYSVEKIKQILYNYNNEGITTEEEIYLESFSLPLYNNDDDYHKQFYSSFYDQIDDLDEVIKEFGLSKYNKIVHNQTELEGLGVFWETSLLASEYVEEYKFTKLEYLYKGL